MRKCAAGMQGPLLAAVLCLALRPAPAAPPPSAPPAADDPCAGFKWDVGRERALFAGTPQSVSGATDAAAAPAVALDRLYEMQLVPQAEVAFAAPPGRRNRPADARAGMAVVHIVTPGTYRISLDAPVWVDVVAKDGLIKAEDFQGAHGCQAPHKIVAFELPAAGAYVVQVSAALPERVRLAITVPPVRKQ